MRFLSLILAASLLGYTPPAYPAEAAAHGHDHPPADGVVALDVYQDGNRLHLLTAETVRAETAAKLWHQSSTDGGKTWSERAIVNRDLAPPQGATRGNDPQIAAFGEDLVAVWMTRGTGLFDSGPMVTALSSDGGKSWRAGVNPADDGTTGGHGFIALGADAAGKFHLTWLDSRDGAQGLRYTLSTDAGSTWLTNRTLDSRTCECCWNSIATGRAGPYVLYRDTEPRDMRLAKADPAGSTIRLGEFGWNFTGCPHVGGGLAVTTTGERETIHAAVWTGQEGSMGLYYVRTEDGTVRKPIAVGGENAWHSDVAAGQDGRVALAWDKKTDAGTTEIWAAVSNDNGATWSTPRQISAPEVSASHPRLVPVADGFRAFWTEAPKGHQNYRWQSAPITTE